MFVKYLKLSATTVGAISILLCLGFLSSCTPNDSGARSLESFEIIYDKPGTSSYTAVDVKQTGDNGYIILGVLDHYPYLLKADKQGRFLWDSDLPAAHETLGEYKAPISDLMVFDNEYYFFSSGITGKAGRENSNNEVILDLLKISESQRQPEIINVSFSQDFFDTYHWLKLGREFTAKPFNVSHNGNNSLLLLASVGVFGDVFLLHLDRTGAMLTVELNNLPDVPCQLAYSSSDAKNQITGVIESSGRYYFQTHRYYYDTAQKQHVTNCGQESGCFRIEIEGFGGAVCYEEPFIALSLKMDKTSGNINFFGARVTDAVISLYVNSSIITDGNGFLESIFIREEFLQPELLPDKPVYIEQMELNGKSLVFFAGSTKGNEIVLYTYNLASDTYKKEYFGHTHLYEAAGLLKTADQGLLILGTTYIAGQMGRICLFKVSKKDLEEMAEAN